MSKSSAINHIYNPVREKPIQAYFGQGLHTLGLLGWLLPQIGKADVFVSSYSTSEAFLNGFLHLKEKELVKSSVLLLDHRAARKTIKLERLMASAFDNVFLGQNHSKLLLLRGDDLFVSVITSQNQTYGSRAESTIITTDRDVFRVLTEQFFEVCGKGSVEIDLRNGTGIITENRAACEAPSDTSTDLRPFDVEW